MLDEDCPDYPTPESIKSRLHTARTTLSCPHLTQALLLGDGRIKVSTRRAAASSCRLKVSGRSEVLDGWLDLKRRTFMGEQPSLSIHTPKCCFGLLCNAEPDTDTCNLQSCTGWHCEKQQGQQKQLYDDNTFRTDAASWCIAVDAGHVGGVYVRQNVLDVHQ